MISKFVLGVLLLTVAMFAKQTVASRLPDGKKKTASDDAKESDHSLVDRIDGVWDITPRYFDSYLIPQKKSSAPRHWIVVFYTRWCTSCNQLIEPLAKAAKQLSREDLKFGKVDVTTDEGPANKYGIDGFPAIVAFHKNSLAVESRFEGERTADAIVAWAENVLRSD